MCTKHSSLKDCNRHSKEGLEQHDDEGGTNCENYLLLEPAFGCCNFLPFSHHIVVKKTKIASKTGKKGKNATPKCWLTTKG